MTLGLWLIIAFVLGAAVAGIEIIRRHRRRKRFIKKVFDSMTSEPPKIVEDKIKNSGEAVVKFVESNPITEEMRLDGIEMARWLVDYTDFVIEQYSGGEDMEYMTKRKIIRGFVRWQLEQEMIDPLTIDYEVVETYLDKNNE